MELGELLFNPSCDWFPSFSKDEFVISVPSRVIAVTLIRLGYERLAQLARTWGVSVTRVRYPNGCFEVPAGEDPMTNNSINLVIPELDFDLNEVYRSEDPVYITQLSDQSVLFTNPAGLAAQSKTPKEFQGENATSLAWGDELIRREGLLRNSNGLLTDYEYQGLRWFKDPDTGLWQRKLMNFVSQFRLVDFLGVPCRMGTTLSAEFTGTLV